ncbi:unnamed protein product [Discula destructiva]
MKLDDATAFVGGDYDPTPLMTTNIVFRFVLNLGAAFACWVPLNLFYRHRELAGAAMVMATAIMNFYYGINSIIWPNNDIASWFGGFVWCDVQLALWTPLETINAAAICAVMQNIANQVSLMRASSLTPQEKRRKHMVQALIIFSVPVLQLILYYFTIGMRYNISGIVGCQAVFQANWVFLVAFILPCPLFAVAAAYFAALTWWRYRQIDASSRRALCNSGSHGAQARSARVRRKLYWMALTIVAPYCPMQLIFLFNNLRVGWPWSKVYDLAQLHAPGWAEIDYAPSTTVSFVSMYINYIVFLEVAVFFLYFGGTKDAHEMYRRYLRAMGLAKLFPSLNDQWHLSDRPPTTFKNLWPRKQSLSSFVSSMNTNSRTSSTYKAKSHLTEKTLSDIDDTKVLNIRVDSMDLERATASLDAARSSDEGPRMPRRGPRLLHLNIVPRFHLPNMPRPAVFRNKTEKKFEYPGQNSLASTILARHHLTPRAHVLSQNSRADVVCNVEPRRKDIALQVPRSQASDVFNPAVVRNPDQGLADYEAGLVSIGRDFSIAAPMSDQRPHPW